MGNDVPFVSSKEPPMKAVSVNAIRVALAAWREAAQKHGNLYIAPDVDPSSTLVKQPYTYEIDTVSGARVPVRGAGVSRPIPLADPSLIEQLSEATRKWIDRERARRFMPNATEAMIRRGYDIAAPKPDAYTARGDALGLGVSTVEPPRELPRLRTLRVHQNVGVGSAYREEE